jgi:hypothetical protein
MSVYKNPRWLDRIIVIDKRKAHELIAKLNEAGVHASRADIGLRSDVEEIEAILIPEEHEEVARKIVRAFNAAK